MIGLALLLLGLPTVLAIASTMLPSRRSLEQLNMAGAGVLALFGAVLAVRVLGQGPLHALGGLLYADALSAFEVVIAVVVVLAAQLYAPSYLGYEHACGHLDLKALARYHALINAFAAAFLLVCLAGNPALTWIALEATTLTTVFLVAFYRRQASVEAAWKYLVLCTVGLILALMGVLLVIAAAIRVIPVAATLDWPALVAIAPRLDPRLLSLAFVFIVVGYGTKVGLAPLHTWLPDAHSEAPSPVSGMLSGMLLNGAMYGILRIRLLLTHSVAGPFAGHLLVGFGLLSLAVAAPLVLVQRDLKRLLAYSSIEHMGIIAMGVGFGGPLGVLGALLHTLYHALAKPALFFAAGNLGLKFGTRDLGAMQGAIATLPITGAAFALGVLAIMGAPPFGLFISELTIARAGFIGGEGWAAVAMLALLVLIAAGFAVHATRLLMGDPVGGSDRGEVTRWGWVPIIGLLGLCAMLGVYLPGPIGHALAQAVRLLS